MLEAADELTPMGKLLVLVDHAPRCRCGGNCETLQYLAKELIEAQSQEQPLLFPNRPSQVDLERQSEAGTLVSWFPKD
jgi:hypothetical protein